MKKETFFGVIGVWLMIAFLGLAIYPASVEGSEQIKLKFSNFFPPASEISKVCEEFIADIDKRTNGRVKITYFPGGSLLKAPATFMGVVEGAADIGFISISYTPGRMPVTEILNLPLGFPNPWVAVHVANDFYKKIRPKEWDPVHVMWMHSSGVTILMTKKPVRKMEDLKGLIIRAPARIGEVIKALGGTPGQTEMAEVYDALSKGVFQGIYSGVMGLKDWRYAEVTKYTTLCWEISGIYGLAVVMNKGTWNKLPEDIKAVFNKTSEEYEEKFAKVWNAAELAGKEYGKSLKVEFINLPKEEANRWKQAVRPVIDAYEKEMVKKGFKKEDVTSWINFAQERIDYWTKKQIQLGIKSATGPTEVLK